MCTRESVRVCSIREKQMMKEKKKKGVGEEYKQRHRNKHEANQDLRQGTTQTQ